MLYHHTQMWPQEISTVGNTEFDLPSSFCVMPPHSLEAFEETSFWKLAFSIIWNATTNLILIPMRGKGLRIIFSLESLPECIPLKYLRPERIYYEKKKQSGRRNLDFFGQSKSDIRCLQLRKACYFLHTCTYIIFSVSNSAVFSKIVCSHKINFTFKVIISFLSWWCIFHFFACLFTKSRAFILKQD